MSNTITTAAQLEIKIGGSAVSPEFMRSVREVVVDTTLHLPAMFTIRLQDNDAKWADNESLLKIGNAVEIALTAPTQGERSGVKGTLISGEITALEPSFQRVGAMLSITGYCRSHRLHRGKYTKTWLKQKDSAIVSGIASESGLSPSVDDSKVTHEYVVQYNQTHWEFICERAARIGYRFYVENKTLYFKAAADGQSSGVDLIWGENLRRFKPRLTAAQQSLSSQVRGWDPKTKKEIVGTATADTNPIVPAVGASNGIGAVASIFGAGTSSLVTTPLGTQNYATSLAKAASQYRSGKAIQAEGEAMGDPRILAGKAVTIKGVGTRFGGTYTVTAASHHWDSEGAYITRFSINGQDPATLYALLPNQDAAASGREYGMVVGLVTNVNDPDGYGRVKVKFPWLSDTLESNWARVASPMAGASRGFMFIPEVNDEVLVAFEHGDFAYPYVVGALWNGKDKPPIATSALQSGGKIDQRIIQTRVGHKIILMDKAGAESIKIVDKTGKNSIEIDSVKNDMTFLAEGNVSITAKGKITLSAQMDVMIESKTGKMTLKGTSGVSVQTPASLELKGSTVQIQGSGPVTVKGNPIMLN